MSDTPTQKGTSYQIGFGSLSYTGYVPEDGVEWKKPREVDEVTDTNNSVVSLLISNPRETLNVTFKILTTGGSLTPPADGDTLSLTDPGGSTQSFIAQDGSVQLGRKHAMLTVGLTYYPDLSLT